MLRLPVFGCASPSNIDELVVALRAPGARLVAGGTDLLPNLKHFLHAPTTLVSMDRVSELQGIRWDVDAGVVRIGAGVTLSRIAEDARLAARCPSLSKAAGLIASPLIRNMATIGGNINLDTRCRYVNQSEFWRGAIGGCLKSEGDVCHVVPKGRSCVAAMSSDCVPVLITLGAYLVQVGPEGRREIDVADYYHSDGIAHTRCADGEFTAEICVPLPNSASRATYAKWTVRKSIDFPLVSVAMRFDLDADSVDSDITAARVCLGVLAARPKLLRTEALIGKRLSDPATAALLGELCFKQGKPLDNVPYEASYRRKMLRVFARRALQDLAGQSDAG